MMIKHPGQWIYDFVALMMGLIVIGAAAAAIWYDPGQSPVDYYNWLMEPPAEEMTIDQSTHDPHDPPLEMDHHDMHEHDAPEPLPEHTQYDDIEAYLEST